MFPNFSKQHLHKSIIGCVFSDFFTGPWKMLREFNDSVSHIAGGAIAAPLLVPGKLAVY